jgi:hypothetical protein
MSKRFYDTSTDTAWSSMMWFYVGSARVLIRSSKMNIRRFMWFRPPEHNILHPREMLYCRVCVALFKAKFNLAKRTFSKSVVA